MSRASAAVLFPDGMIKYAIYNGTTDILWPRLFTTLDEAWDAYSRTRDAVEAWADIFDRPAGLDRAVGEPVRIYEDYGGGSEWAGRATREFVTSECDAFEIEDAIDYDLDTQPDWLAWR